MAEDVKDTGTTEEMDIASNDKTPISTEEGGKTTAPIEDKTTVDAPEADDFEDVISLLNIMDEQIGGKGAIAGIPDELKGSIKYLVDQLTFVKEAFEDPNWMAILDDMADQKEDGVTPSVLVAIARNIPLDELQKLSESEDYEGAQKSLVEDLSTKKKSETEDAEFEASFAESQKAGEEYAAEMGYDEARKNELFQKVIDILQATADGKITKEEFAEIDKMLNYGPDTESLRGQLASQGSKEVLPDKASVESTISSSKPIVKKVADGPGMQSMANDTPPAYLGVGKKRFRK